MLGTCGAGAALALGAGCLERLGDTNGGGGESNGEETAERTDVWASFRGGPSNSGFAEVDGPRGDPDRRWTADTAPPRTAAIADGSVYLAAGSTLHAFDLADGDEQWSVDLGDLAIGSPAVADDAVVCPVEGTLVVVDRDGGERARVPLDGGTANVDSMTRRQYRLEVRSSPTVVDGTAYLGTIDGDLVAVDLEDESVAWRSSATEGWTALSQERSSSNGVTSPAVVGGRVIVGTRSGVAAFDAADGSPEWTHETDRSVRSTPAVVDGTVYVGHVPPMALSAADGDPEWRADDAVESLRRSGRDRRPARPLSRQELRRTAPSVAVADDVVVAHDPYDRLLALERDGGDRRWETPLERIESLSATQRAPSWSSPVIAGDVVVVGTPSGIVATSLTDGEPLWRVPTDRHVVASPAVVDGTVVVGDAGGTIYALEGSD